METLKTIEFYTTPDGSVYYKIPGQESRRLTKFNVDIIDPLLEQIKQRFPECYAALATKYRNKRFDMADRFIRCNFGEHDLLTQDIDNDVLHFEEVRCPLRGICEHEGVICKPKSMVSLSRCEREIADLYLEGLTFRDIAAKLGKNAETVKVQLMRIKKKCGVKHCRDIIRVLRLKNY